MSKATDDIAAAVTKITNAAHAAAEAFKQISAKITAGVQNSDDEALEKLAADLNTEADTLGAAVAANTTPAA